ncbi:MAG: mitochondrial fission ELM1 family protein [Kiritimatiellales bacterium]|nr:mitochondrial fission ELM1 family protein [Kiritimatiellota bacterium]MBL7011604.1 mitochondrial fission ELM1 family protein [Kiritimatiellales bacterium]
MNALILTDGKPGHFNQSVALCTNTGLNYELVEVSYRSKTAKALSYLFDHRGIYTEKLFTCHLSPATCHLIVSTGSTTFYPNKVLARKLGLPNIAILNPKGYRPDFSAILCPAYDHPPKKENIIELPLNLCAADPAFFEEKTAEFKTKHAAQAPAVGFIIGGSNAVSTMDAAELKTKLEQAFALTEGCERWVTTSRRTPKEVEELIEALPFDYTLINSCDPYNPVPAFIQLCDRLFVTSDSASMASETASFGSANVEILMNRQLKSPNKFEELFQGLEKRGAVHLFDGTLGHADKKIDLAPLLKQALNRAIRH